VLLFVEETCDLPDEALNLLMSKGWLSHNVERVPSGHFMSITSPSNHDTCTIREWWETDKKGVSEFWKNYLKRDDPIWKECASWISQSVIERHLKSECMWATFLLQDITGIMDNLRRHKPSEERINDPSDPDWRWNSRYPFTVEELVADQEFTSLFGRMLKESCRNGGGR
jgi:4-alpha-glucanotransferase